jgi:hypothetical protein
MGSVAGSMGQKLRYAEQVDMLSRGSRAGAGLCDGAMRGKPEEAPDFA